MLFDYTQEGQRKWAKYFPKCGGYWQSPIILAASRSIALPLPALEMIGYRNLLAPLLVFTNNGHTVSLKVKNEFTKDRIPYIFGAMLNKNQEYELESFHFHWGVKNGKGSEHLLHGIRYPMEMHLIHRNMKYKDLSTALQYEDGLAVLGIFFQLQEDDNEQLKPLIAHLPAIQSANTETRLNTTMTLASLLPPQLDTYYTYKGSLTTPPCNEVVTWIVFTSMIPISYKQMSKFRVLSNGKGIIADNYRNAQVLGNRKVYVRRIQSVLRNKNDMDYLDVSTLKWYWT
ncbi:PREDICTED: carbonic anhydrase 2-like [Ceratosolen solmsi marchali]|uniref:Carbonic anhydrase n=1 Tax=Ceratosolen solmsi marchali TaxID=326594 RepID=A0AAJ6YE64_9HYME|nr:PREDICTED: carbonic anhydrase 2-like [Ceratosolen solmsi marchali]